MLPKIRANGGRGPEVYMLNAGSCITLRVEREGGRKEMGGEEVGKTGKRREGSRE